MTTDQFSRSDNPATGSSRSQQGPGSGSQGSSPRTSSASPSSTSPDLRSKAGEAASKVGEAAQQAGSKATEAASSLASEANRRTRGLLNQQVAAGADLVGHVADSAKTAADSLDRTSPQLAGVVRSAADRIEDFSRDIRGQSVEEMFRSASDFTRRQPALVFGLASLAGFFLFRLLKSSPPNDGQMADRSDEPYTAGGPYGERMTERYGAGAGQFHGV